MLNYKKILITGGAGFIGSAVIRHIMNNTDHSVVNVDKLTYAGNLESLTSIESDSRYAQDNEFIFVGVARPTSVSVDTYGTVAEGLNDDVLSTFVIESFSLTPNWITKKCALDKAKCRDIYLCRYRRKRSSWII